MGNEDGTISIINLASEKAETLLAADVREANRLKFTPDGRMVLVTTHTGRDLVVIDVHTRKQISASRSNNVAHRGVRCNPTALEPLWPPRSLCSRDRSPPAHDGSEARRRRRTAVSPGGLAKSAAHNPRDKE